ncbi:MAG: cation efflux protein, partial [Bacilli bacterium]|nr:cation efflux protein [Bacilli bacterium]
MEQTIQVKKGIAIEWISVAWMVVEAAVAIEAGLAAHSLALTAFGADSLIELVAGMVLLWRLYTEANGKSAMRVARAEKASSWIVGISLLLIALYIIIASFHALQTHSKAESSITGISLAIASGILMPILSKLKINIGNQIGSQALKADGACSIVCAYMAWTLLAGLVLTTLFGWWWVDAITSLWIAYFAVREGVEAIQEAKGALCLMLCRGKPGSIFSNGRSICPRAFIRWIVGQ